MDAHFSGLLDTQTLTSLRALAKFTAFL